MLPGGGGGRGNVSKERTGNRAPANPTKAATKKCGVRGVEQMRSEHRLERTRRWGSQEDDLPRGRCGGRRQRWFGKTFQR